MMIVLCIGSPRVVMGVQHFCPWGEDDMQDCTFQGWILLCFVLSLVAVLGCVCRRWKDLTLQCRVLTTELVCTLSQARARPIQARATPVPERPARRLKQEQPIRNFGREPEPERKEFSFAKGAHPSDLLRTPEAPTLMAAMEALKYCPSRYLIEHQIRATPLETSGVVCSNRFVSPFDVQQAPERVDGSLFLMLDVEQHRSPSKNGPCFHPEDEHRSSSPDGVLDDIERIAFTLKEAPLEMRKSCSRAPDTALPMFLDAEPCNSIVDVQDQVLHNATQPTDIVPVSMRALDAEGDVAQERNGVKAVSVDDEVADERSCWLRAPRSPVNRK